MSAFIFLEPISIGAASNHIPLARQISFPSLGIHYDRADRQAEESSVKIVYKSTLKVEYWENIASIMSPTVSTLKMGDLTDLTGKVALVTGGGGGVGLMIAKGLASNDAKVYIAGRRLNVLQQAAVQTFEGTGCLVPLQVDVMSKEDILSAVSKIGDSDEKLDILVNTAGAVGSHKPASSASDDNSTHSANSGLGAYGRDLFDNQTFEEWGFLAQMNVASYFFLTTAFLDLLVKSTQGKEGEMASVINITSVAGQMRLSAGSFIYPTIRAATAHLTRILATDFSLKGVPVRVNAIAPGCFPSETVNEQIQADMTTKVNGMFLQPVPMRRPGREHEMAALAVYLASPASAYVHGQEITIDGGLRGANP